jgi:hypothetical protein
VQRASRMATHKRRPSRVKGGANIGGISKHAIDLGGCVTSRRSGQTVVEFLRPVSENASIFLGDCATGFVTRYFRNGRPTFCFDTDVLEL